MYYLSKGNSYHLCLSHQWSCVNNALPKQHSEPAASGPIFIHWAIQTQVSLRGHAQLEQEIEF